MKTIYNINYDFYKAFCKIEIDREKFTEKKAKDTLTFFSWDYDEDADPIDEAAKKYAMLAIEKATEGYSLFDLREKEFEGFYKMNGKEGILLVEVDAFEFNEELLDVIKN